MGWYFAAWKKYAVFSGRARRKEYWYFYLFWVITSWVLFLLDTVLGLNLSEANVGILSLIYMLASMLPGWGVSVRRLHDTGRSGWWLLVIAVPLIGYVALIIFFAQKSQEGENKYGPNPISEVA